MATTLQAAIREDFRSSRLTKIRESGNIPAVIYGKEFGNKPIAVEEIGFIKLFRQVGRTGVFQINLDGEKTDVMIYDLQYDSIKNKVIHIDFYAVNMKTEMDVNVPVHVVGEAKGVNDGGVVSQSLFEVSVHALPNNIPDQLELDISDMEVNDTLTVADLKADGDFEINNEADESILSILPPTEEPEEDEEAADEDAEPELVGAEDKESSEENEK